MLGHLRPDTRPRRPRADYVGFWRYVLAVCDDVRTNGLVPVVPCICLPDQLLAAVEDEVVHFLALVSDPRRSPAGSPTGATGPLWATFDVTTGDVRRTREAGAAWAEQHTP